MTEADAMTPEERKVQAAHEKHAWTLAFLVYACFGVLVYFLAAWLHSVRSSWAELAYFALYVVSFFAVFALGAVKDWFLYRIYNPSDDE